MINPNGPTPNPSASNTNSVNAVKAGNKILKDINAVGRLNPNIDSRLNVIRTLDGSNATPLKKGTVRNANGAYVQFMFNPQQVQVSHTMNIMTPMPTSQDPNVAADQASLIGQVGTASYSLLFDRTYEMWDSSSSAAFKTYGVYLDVLAFYRLVGLVLPGHTDPTAPMAMTGDLVTSMGPGLTFKGPISDLNITYTHWTNKLVPIRCAIQVSQWMFPVSDLQASIQIQSDLSGGLLFGGGSGGTSANSSGVLGGLGGANPNVSTPPTGGAGPFGAQ